MQVPKKYAIRIINNKDEKGRLFAVIPKLPIEQVTRYYNLAKKSIEYGSSEWITVRPWN